MKRFLCHPIYFYHAFLQAFLIEKYYLWQLETYSQISSNCLRNSFEAINQQSLNFQYMLNRWQSLHKSKATAVSSQVLFWKITRLSISFLLDYCNVFKNCGISNHLKDTWKMQIVAWMQFRFGFLFYIFLGSDLRHSLCAKQKWLTLVFSFYQIAKSVIKWVRVGKRTRRSSSYFFVPTRGNF